jgi:putative tricarboxylic transport membrane protein
MRVAGYVVSIALAVASASAAAQGWVPTKNVEIVAGSAPGGSNDRTARLMELVLNKYKLVPTSITIINKAGGGGSIAYTYVHQHPGDPHYLGIVGTGLMSNEIIGASPLGYKDFTPIATLMNDYAVFAVATQSALPNGKELADRVKKDPRSLTVGFANAFGSTRHQAVGLFVKTLGGDPRQLKPVVFKGSAPAITALLGGHIEYVVVGAVNTISHVANKKMRVLGVAAPKRLSGPLADVPTWKELGVDFVSGSWRGIVGAKGLTPAQVTYWENALRKMTEAPEWKTDLEKNYWTDDFSTGEKLKKDLDGEFAETKALLADLGLAK